MNQTEEVAQTNEMENGYKVDIALVIDATGSMGPMIEQIKNKPLMFAEKIKERLEERSQPVSQLRMRVIDFADFAFEGGEAIHASKFFNIPEEQAELEKAVRAIEYKDRGGDEPENALEALWTAINSDWVDLSGIKKGRHVIIVITDAYPLHLGERNGCKDYVAEDYPESVQKMEEIWNETQCPREGGRKLDPRKKRLLLLVPKGNDGWHSWDEVSEWDYTIIETIDSNTDFSELNLNYAINSIIGGW